MQKEQNLHAIVIAALEDLKGNDIVSFNVAKLTSITDYMVFCSGTSSRHVKSLAENVITMAKQNGFKPLGIEGQQEGEWVLVDLIDVVVHVMLPQVREFYQLEKLWSMPESDQSSDQ